MPTEVKGISSMATRLVLADLLAQYQKLSGLRVAVESVGGVDATRRIGAGEDFDVVVLASDALDRLIHGGHVMADSRVVLAHCGVGVAVRAGAPMPDIASEDALKEAVRVARSVGYSSGPSGVAVASLFERWGIAQDIRDRIVTPAPGIAVGTLVARGQVELGFQQLSELLHVPGVALLGPLPPAIQFITTFCAGVGTRSRQGEAARDLIDYLSSPACSDAKRRHGMQPGSP